MKNKRIKVLLMPGLGADKRMFGPLLHELELCGLQFSCDWIHYPELAHPYENLRSYSFRLYHASQIQSEYDLVPSPSKYYVFDMALKLYRIDIYCKIGV